MVTEPKAFATTSYRGRELGAPDLVALQSFFDANPEYFQWINGRPPHADEARSELGDVPPAGMPFRSRWFTGFFDRDGRLVGVSSVLTDFLAEGVGHIGLFLVATRLHGSGAAAELCDALEAALVDDGARWIRLGVVVGNVRGERFWARRGYRELRLRRGVDTGGRINDVRVLVKPLCGGAHDEYFDLVPRDHPDSTLP